MRLRRGATESTDTRDDQVKLSDNKYLVHWWSVIGNPDHKFWSTLDADVMSNAMEDLFARQSRHISRIGRYQFVDEFYSTKSCW